MMFRLPELRLGTFCLSVTHGRWSFLAAVAGAALFLGRAQADLIVSAPNIVAAPGSSGSFDVLLSNTGAGGIFVDAFTFDISTPSPAVALLSASTNTTAAPYIYAGDSFVTMNGLPFATRTGQELTASDLVNGFICQTTCTGTVNPGMTLSLGEVFFTAASSAAFGSVPISFSTAGTSLADANGAPIAFSAVNGELSLAPEVNSGLLLLAGLGLCAIVRAHLLSRQQKT